MKKRLTIYIFLVAALGIALSSLFGAWVYSNQEREAASQTLTELLSLIDAQGYDTQAEELELQFTQAAPDKRLTIIAPDGTVLANSWGILEENHGDRPEVISAFETGFGESIRSSDTTKTTMLYVARLLSDGNVARISMPISSVNFLVTQGLVGFVGSAVVVLLLSLWLARKLAVHMTSPLEHKEKALNKEEEKLKSARSEFAANVSHELKTPLTSIKGFTDMLSSGMVKEPEAQQRFITMIGVEVDRLMELINDVLKLSELESVAMSRTEDRANAWAVAEEVIDALEPNAEKAGVHLTLSGEPVSVAIPEGRLRELMSNLVENSIKYNEEDGRVDVTITCRDKNVTILVADTGIGIPKEAQGRVFERFYRVDKGRARKSGGTGLGLAIVKHICQVYGGKLTLESQVGRGTDISIVLPLVEE